MIEFHIIIEEAAGKLSLAIMPRRSLNITDREKDAYDTLEDRMLGGLEQIQQTTPENSVMIAGRDSVRQMILRQMGREGAE
jgi:hypothetical protein